MNSPSRGVVSIVLAVAGSVGIASDAGAGGPLAAPVELLCARRFVLDHAYSSAMRSDRPLVSAGYLVVVEADQELTVPRQGLGPVLFVGEWPVEVLNSGRGSGRVVAIVPVPLDLQASPIFYAVPDLLPESLPPSTARALAGAAGAALPTEEAVQAALEAGGSPAVLSDRYELRLRGADLIERYSPEESDVVSGLRAPLLRGEGVSLDRQRGAGPAAFGQVGRGVAEKHEKLLIEPTRTELAGGALTSFPFFEYARALNVGSPVQAAVDSARFGLAGQTADIHVVVAKSRAEWIADPSLEDVSSGGAEAVSFVAGPIQDNTFTVDTGTLNADAGAGVGVGYDVVVDLDHDGQLGAGDLVDGYGDEAGFYVVHDVTQAGPHPVTEILYSGGALLGQNTFYPTNVGDMGELPLVVISHGNGHYFQWYDHIGYHLASYGYIVMSHENNTEPGIESASTTTLTNTDYFLGHLNVIANGDLQGHVDARSIVWIGHSRGGEGIVRAYDRIFDGAWVPVEYGLGDLRLLSSIAPTDFLGPDSSNPHAVPYHVWVGGADDDVHGCPELDLALSFSLLDRAERDRQSISLHGVGHGDFHNGGGSSWAQGPCLVGRPTTHIVMRGYLLPLVEYYLHGNLAAEDFLWRQWESFHPIGAPTSSCVVVDLYFRKGNGAGTTVIDDFQTQFSPTVSSSGGDVSYTVTELTEGFLNDGNSSFTHDPSDPMNGMTVGGNGDLTRGIVFTFDAGALQILEFDLPPSSRDLTGWTHLSLRAAQATRHPLTTGELGDASFTVTLVDGQSAESSINIGAYGGGVEEPYQRFGCGNGVGWNNEFETVRVRLSDFLNNGSTLNLGDVSKIVLRFGPGYGSVAGRLGLDDVELVGGGPELFADGFESGDATAWSAVVP